MEDENVLDQQTEEAAEEAAEEPTEEASEDAEAAEAEAEENTEPTEEEETASEDAFDYDENGDIIIPDGIEEESPSDGGENVAEAADARDDRDEENARLREELEELRFRTKDALKKLGVDTEDVIDGLAEVASESSDVSKEEYNAQLAKEMQKKREAEAKKIADFETLAAKDLAELQQIYPDTKAYKHVRDMPEEVLKKFAQYRNMGLPAKEAYAAANIDGIRNGATAVGKKQALNDSKAHLQSSKPKANSRSALRISAKEMETWRGMFPGKSDKEIAALYKKTL